jgi:glucose-6-phosphate 1-epimerase
MMRKQWNDVWCTEIESADGARAVIADHGAHLLSWIPAGGEDALYLSEKSAYGGTAAIRGGVPIIFPQFGARGDGKRHGFARNLAWEPVFAGVENGRGVARYRLVHNSTTDVQLPPHWPHFAELDYAVVFSGSELHLSLSVRNPSAESWEFCAALHTYLRVADIAQVTLSGLHGLDYLDQVRDGAPAREEQPVLRIDAEIDRIYAAAHEPLLLDDGKRRIAIGKQGFDDVVVWNPGAEKAAALPDMQARDYRSFVCVESGAIMQPIVLRSGESWIGSQSFTVNQSQA